MKLVVVWAFGCVVDEDRQGPRRVGARGKMEPRLYPFAPGAELESLTVGGQSRLWGRERADGDCQGGRAGWCLRIRGVGHGTRG